ncbi:hypothetical protein [Nitrincola sp. A-D6]|uniref:hypothetical protein n=1 Tax=Nitrincola sp. A-D6 TaxID=1545442 RepID=UPI0011852B3C|nr:hypothetical protein [Nitrincola sp. A-D6]
MLTSQTPLIRIFLVYFLLLIAGFTAPVFAQEASDTTDSANSPPSSTLLADLLENPETRDQLISELRSLANPENAEAAEASQASLIRQIADTTQAFAQQMTQQMLEPLQSSPNWGIVTGS